MTDEAARTARELQMLEAMVDCAHALGMAFGAAAQREAETQGGLALFDAFQRSFLAVRMGIRLSLALRAQLRAARPALRNEPNVTDTERDPVERESPDWIERDRERERDEEAVSLPKFLASLRRVAADAGTLPGPAPTALPALRRLLEDVQADPPAAPRRPDLRARLAGSTSAPPVATLPRRPDPGRPRPPPWPSSG